VNAKIRRRIARAKQKIESRLASAVVINEGGPVMRGKPRYELSDKARANPWGGIGVFHRLARKLKLPESINNALHLLKLHVPYHESDHVLNIAYNLLCGGRTLDDIEHRRQCQAYLDTLGTQSIPDPTTAGDFCRRFDENAIWSLMEAFNEVRVAVWRKRGKPLLSQTARIDADGTMVATTGECKQGIDIAYDGTWGYHPLLVSLANTQEPLFIVNRSGNRPSHEGAAPVFDLAITLCREAGFQDVLLRGDTDFALTTSFDRWTDQEVRFVLGYDAKPNLVVKSEETDDSEYRKLVQRAEREIATKPRTRPFKEKDAIVRERKYNVLVTKAEVVTEFMYRPTSCKRDYRFVVLRKTLDNQRGQESLFEEYRYFFYVTNDLELSLDEVVHEARQRCNQENLHDQLKNSVRAFHAPVNTLLANWAYMVMASLAWSLKAWAALLLHASPRWREQHERERDQLLRMEFRAFVAYFVSVPCQVVLAARQIALRVLAWNRWLATFFRLLEAT
jgi:Transposase DDE domain group 1